MKNLNLSFTAFLFLFIFSSCDHAGDFLDELKPAVPKIKDFATGLATPLGLELDKRNRLWVTEAGTGNNDGQVSIIMPSGEVYTAIEGFVSAIDPEGNPSGLNHLLWHEGTLWILHGVEGRLYQAAIADFQPGDTPLQASELEYQEISGFVLGQGYVESNLYNLAIGTEGDLFLVDAAANALIRRDAQTAALSVFAEFPPSTNPTPVGPPLIDAVPTGIVYDGDRFLVTTLTGFPFPEGEARVYAVDKDGQLSVYQDGLTALVDIELPLGKPPLVLQFSEFGATGWIPGSGKITQVSSAQEKVVVEGLNFASDMELRSPGVAFVTNLAEGKVVRIIF